MKYKVLLITKDSTHEAVDDIEDEEMLIVECEDGTWCEASEFFFQNDILEFEVTKTQED